MWETGVWFPIEAHWIFPFRQNPLLHLVPNYGIHWSICMVKVWGHTFPRGGWMWWQSCLGGLAVMTLTQNARDWGSIPRWGTLNFSVPSEPTATLFLQLCTQLKAVLVAKWFRAIVHEWLRGMPLVFRGYLIVENWIGFHASSKSSAGVAPKVNVMWMWRSTETKGSTLALRIGADITSSQNRSISDPTEGLMTKQKVFPI